MTPENGRHLSFPFRVGVGGRTAQVSTLEEHVRDEIIQLLLTSPAERLFLPEFGGHGMYGRRVHEAVIEAGVAESGACIHVVDEEYDRGPVVARRTVPVAARTEAASRGCRRGASCRRAARASA